MDVLKALAVLADSGITLSEEQEAALAEFKSATMREEAEKVFARKVNAPEKTKKSAQEKWMNLSFKLAQDVANEIIGANVGRGRGEVHEQMFRIETPSGSLKVSLTNEPKAE